MARTPSGMIATRAPALRAAVSATRSMVPSSWPMTSTGLGPPAIASARRTVMRALRIARGVGMKPSGRSTRDSSSSGIAVHV